eukprot:Hpha_TRINITY_DN15917_c5_g3::TRINITY_DN15917_c5_g3_i3::g.74879::m.74879
MGDTWQRLVDHFRVYDAPWNYLNSLEKQVAEHPTFVIGEFLFIGLAVLALYHALTAEKAAERRLLLVWAGTFIIGTANDYFFMLLPLVDNFWQAQAIIMLTPRMPLYIPCVYNGFMYWSTVAAARIFRHWKKNLFAEAALAGVLGGIIYAPYDYVGARFLWWTWHHDDPAVRLRWLGVPASSTTWSIVFTFCFALLLRLGEDWGWSEMKSLALAGLTTPLMMMLMTPFTLLGFDTVGLISPRTILASAAVFSGIVVWGLRSPSRGEVTLRLQKSESNLVRFSILGFFLTCVFVMVTFSPERQISTGLHQEFGDCETTDLDMMGIKRMRFICSNEYPRAYWSIDCPQASQGEGRWARKTPTGSMGSLSSWYTICGVPHTRYLFYVSAMAALSLVGSAFYLWAFGEQPDPSPDPPARPSSVSR